MTQTGGAFDPARMRRINELMDQALDLEPTDVEAFLADACADDPSLAAEVRAMLAYDTFEPAFLDKPLVRWDLGPMREGEQLGPFTIRRLLGEGGMGQVYLARQTEPFARDVALKLIKLGRDRDKLLLRFQREQETLARLTHPYIAQVYDAGFSESGNPYFAMEYVDGVPVTRYCEEAALDLKARLELFVSICDAVQYAHQRGIIHRDIKPANLLVSLIEGVAVPKIIDFGIAKLHDRDEVGEGGEQGPATMTLTGLTQTGSILGSLGFMSPEQTAENPEEVDTRTDIYSLGVVLFELLCGRRPLSGALQEGISYQEALLLVRNQVPGPPSQSTEERDGRLRRTLRGDLDAITLKALARNRDDRYASAAALAEDLRGYLRGRPVTARKHTLPYLFTRWVGRHKLGFGAATVVVLALIVGSGFALAGFLRARDANVKSSQTLTILKDFLSSADPARSGKDIKMVDLLADFPKKLDPATRGDVLADVYEIMGDTYSSLGDPPGAGEMYHKALEARLRTEKPEAQASAVTRLKIGAELYALGRYDEAERIYREIISEQTRLHGPRHDLVLDATNRLAGLLGRTDRLDEGIRLVEDALTVRREALGDESIGCTQLRHRLGLLYTQTDQHEKGRALLEQVRTWYTTRHGERFPSTLRVRMDLSLQAFRLGDHDRALDLAVPLMADMREVLGPVHPDTLRIGNILASILFSRQRFAEAEAIFRENLGHSREKLGPDHKDTLALMQNLALAYFALGRADEGLALMREAVQAKERVLGATAGTTLVSKGNLGFLLEDNGYREEARTLLEATLARAREVWDGNNIEFRNILACYVMVLVRDGRFEEANAVATESVMVTEQAASADLESKTNARRYLARVWAETGRLEEALASFAATRADHASVFAADSKELQEYCHWYAEALRAAGRPTEAAALNCP